MIQHCERHKMAYGTALLTSRGSITNTYAYTWYLIPALFEILVFCQQAQHRTTTLLRTLSASAELKNSRMLVPSPLGYEWSCFRVSMLCRESGPFARGSYSGATTSHFGQMICVIYPHYSSAVHDLYDLSGRADRFLICMI